MTFNKKYLCHICAGVAAGILIAFSMKQCSDKEQAREDLGTTTEQMDRAAQTLRDANAMLDSLMNENRSLGQDNRAKADTIRTLRDSILVLNDSLEVVNDQLRDCRNGKKRCPGTTPRQPNPTPVRPTKPVRDTLVIIHDNINRGETNIIINDNSDNNSVNVNNGTVNNYYLTAPADTVRQAGQNFAAASQTIVVKKRTTYVRTK